MIAAAAIPPLGADNAIGSKSSRVPSSDPSVAPLTRSCPAGPNATAFTGGAVPDRGQEPATRQLVDLRRAGDTARSRPTHEPSHLQSLR